MSMEEFVNIRKYNVPEGEGNRAFHCVNDVGRDCAQADISEKSEWFKCEMVIQSVCKEQKGSNNQRRHSIDYMTVRSENSRCDTWTALHTCSGE